MTEPMFPFINPDRPRSIGRTVAQPGLRRLTRDGGAGLQRAYYLAGRRFWEQDLAEAWREQRLEARVRELDAAARHLAKWLGPTLAMYAARREASP